VLADRDAQLAGAEADRLGRHILDPLHDHDRNRAPAAGQGAEQQQARLALGFRFFLGFAQGLVELAFGERDSGALGDARRIEQQDRAAVVGERGPA